MSINDETLITPEAAAERLGIAAGTLRNWRWRKRGPRFVAVGQKVFYRPSDLSTWLATRVVDPEARASS